MSAPNAKHTEIRAQIESVRAMERESDRLKQAARALLREVQTNCLHDGEKRYVPDPSGNNDSYYRCLICEKEL